ncbi:MAG: sugar isomerase domain-containing protein [Spirochaetes bacterium]|nr:sugar isomerase domain-containing protein [Spirochaetota bacterium]
MSGDKNAMWSKEFLTKTRELIRRLEDSQIQPLERASCACADSIAAGRAALVFGAGHSALPCMEAFPRIGSFVGFYQIVEPAFGYNSLVVGKGGQRQMSFLERTRGYASVILSNYSLKPEDSIVIFTHSGINALPVEMASECKKLGMTTIGVTSFEHSRANTPDGATGKRLFEIVDIPIDTGAPEGDSLLEAKDGTRYASISTIASMIVMDAVVARTAQLLIERGHKPVVYPSHNVTSDVETMTAQEERMFDAYSKLQSKLLK